MKTQHTKGEWSLDFSMAEKKSNEIYWIYINSDKGKHIAEVKGKHCEIENSECDANAKLIAAAPELLESCNFMLDVLSGHLKFDLKIAIADMKAAIKKATS